MAAKLLHSLSDDNIDLQKQIGCMNGIFQLFDRHRILTGGGRRVGPKRLPLGISDFNGDSLERESSNAHLGSASVEKFSHKNIQEKQRISTEPSRPSFSSSSRSSSFSSLDCNKASHLEPTSFDRIIFPETTSKEPTMSLQIRDLRDLVKDSMYRDIQGSSVKAKSAEKRDSPRAHSEITNDKFQEAPWHQNYPRTLVRSSSYHSKDGSSYPISKDAPRFSYDGREVNRAPFDSRDVSKSTLKLKDLPRLSLDSKAGSMRCLHADSKSNFFLKSNSGESDDNIQHLQQICGHQTRPPSVVAKLMGLETLPDSISSIDKDKDKDSVNVSASFAQSDPSLIQPSSSSKNSRREPSSPSWRNPDSSMKPMARFPIEPAPWKQIDGRSSQKSTKRTPAKGESTLPSVYSEIEKRLTNLEFTQSGKDLRALKQILEAIQSKGFLPTEKEVQGSNFDYEQKHFHQKSQSEQVLTSTKRTHHMESPIVIMKPAKLVGKSVISPDCLSGVPKLQDNEVFDNRKGLRSSRMAKDSGCRSSQRDSALNSSTMKNERTQRTTQASMRLQNSVKEGNAGLAKSSGSISPRMQQKKLELEKRSRPPIPTDSSKSRRQQNKQQGEANSPGGRRRPKHANIHESGDKPSEVNVESRSFTFHENENPAQSNALVATSGNHSEFMLSGLVEKNSNMALSEDEPADFGIAPLEYSSPVSVLDILVHKDDLPSPMKYTRKTIKVDASVEEERESNVVQESCDDVYNPECSTSAMNRKKLQHIENLVQKLRRLNSSHDEGRTDYIASLCENSNPDHRYISEILLASGLLLRDLGSSLVNFQFHPSGHPINPELYLVLEQTKANTLADECVAKKKTQLMVKERLHRRLIFDAVNEILGRKLGSEGPIKLATRAHNAQKLLRELCAEIEALQGENPKCSFSGDDERWKNILYIDVMHDQSDNWINFGDEISGAVLDIERSIFKDLVDEIVVGESGGRKTRKGVTRRIVME